MRIQVTQTINVSREGLWVRRSEASDLQARMWVLFPFDPAAPASVQPEIPARVVRVMTTPDGDFCLGLHLELPPRGSPRPAAQERRRSPRSLFALPIFVRPSGTPWPEESMTKDISRGGMRFETSRAYTPGETVLAKVPWAEWAKAGEMIGRVVRVEATTDELFLPLIADAKAGEGPVFSSVAVQWMGSGRNLDAETARLLRQATS
jgi:hypothetical protein